MKSLVSRISTTLFLIFMSMSYAHAFTIKSGEVLSDGEVVAAHETELAKKMIAEHGYFISGGVLAVSAGDTVVVLEMSDLIGKSTQQITDILGEEISKNYSEASDISAAAADQAISASREAIGNEVADKITRDVANEVAAEVAASIGDDIVAAVSAEVAAEVAARVEERVQAFQQNGQTELDCQRDSDGNCM